jgi:ankyrin repeat protein
LIDKGAELEAKDNDKLTPLLLSAQNGQLECLKYLIDKGADLKAKDYYKKNTASFICSEWTS